MSVVAPLRETRRQSSSDGISQESRKIAEEEEKIEIHFWEPVTRVRPEKRFAELSATWRSDTAFASSALQMATHPAYQEIIGMGSDALPLILRDLAERPAHWFWALRAISGENPVKAADMGKFASLVGAWLSWGRQKGYLE